MRRMRQKEPVMPINEPQFIGRIAESNYFMTKREAESLSNTSYSMDLMTRSSMRKSWKIFAESKS